MVTAARFVAEITGDVRLALRSIGRMPVLAAVVTVSLAAGIGVNTVVFSWVQAVTLDPLPGVAGGAKLHFIEPVTDKGWRPGVSWLEYEDLRRETRSFRDLLAFSVTPFYVGAPEGGVDRVYGQLVSDNYFSALGLRPAAGRFPTLDDAETAVAVISYGLSQTRFGSTAAAIGRTLRVNGQSLTVIGVMPRPFQGTILGMAFDIWAPARLTPQLFNGSRSLTVRSARVYDVMGMLADGATEARAQSDANAVMARLARDYPGVNQPGRAEVLPFARALNGPQRFLGAAVLTLQAMMLVLLAAVCGNTANLLLARASARQKDAAIRLALGAGRLRIVRLLVVESMLLALLGAAGGVVIAVWGTQGLPTLPLTGFPLRFDAPLDAGGLAFALLLGLACGVFFGLAPAWHLARVLPQAALRGGTLASVTPRSDALRRALMGVQAGFAVIVLVVATLFIRSFLDTRTLDPGFQQDGVLLAAYDLAGQDRGNERELFRRETARRILDGVRAIPEVKHAAIAASVPLDIHGWPSRSITVEGRAAADGQANDEALVNTVTADYFDVMAIPLVAGRRFGEIGTRVAGASGDAEAIVNTEFVRRYLPGSSDVRLKPDATKRLTPDVTKRLTPDVTKRLIPDATKRLEPDVTKRLMPDVTKRLTPDATVGAAIGTRVRANGRAYTIVGVVKTTLYNAFGEAPMPALYFSFNEAPQPVGEIHVRTRGAAEATLAARIRRTINEVDPGTAIVNVRTLTEHVDSNLILRRVPAQMFAALAPMLLLLAAIGIYAVVDFAVTRRTAEVGLRLALGSSARQLVMTFMVQHMSVTGAGVLVGSLIALIIALDTGAADPAVLAGIPVLLLLVAALACWLPVRRAARLDPTTALRNE